MLKTHGRYDYSAIAHRPDYSFPDGKRLAVHLSLNVEHFAFGEGLGNDYGAPQAQPNTRSYAWRDYGNRVGAWRLLEFADKYELPLELLVNTELYDYCPKMIAAFRARGDEIVGHGRTNSERQGDMGYEEERAVIQEATAAIERHEGRKPMGWLAPYISQTHDSLDLLKEAGYRYMMDWPLDDQPVWFATRHGRILAVPYSHDLNDSLEAVTRRTPSQLFCENLLDQFDEMLEESQRRPLVMSIVLHSFILGQPHRLRQFRYVIEHIMEQRDQVWLARAGEICGFIESLPDGIVPGSAGYADRE
ncbi:polysaccharide deacetylase family protein [Bordetella genomosp. 9]|uniref:polysaccharide deacetylase family protein n=1 Tax=Bordetella genomosp. 9 TaxID=1416803 RepID=UPI001177F530|nr:polysaccharide deacetylase family protein [Bordetella genomosp. 9]